MNLIAYLDPGSGSIIIQALIAAVLGAGIFFRQIFFYPLKFFRRPTKQEDEEPKAEETPS